MEDKLNYVKVINILEDTIERQKIRIIHLEQENDLLKASTKPEVARVYSKDSPKKDCDCIDWRDLEPSPFCLKCKGTGSV